MALRAGDWVEVRTKQEILQTLDRNGRLDGLPFMPQMFNYCGQRFKVFRSAHKTCDPIFGYGSLRIPGGVHLDVRCDGKAYGGCQASCLIFWKEAWLKPVPAGSAGHTAPALDEAPSPETKPLPRSRCSEEDVRRVTRVDGGQDERNARYVCQVTQLWDFTWPLRWWDLGQYVEDYRSGNVTLKEVFQGALYVGFGRPIAGRFAFARRLYDAFQARTGGFPLPIRQGTVPAGKAAPVADLNLKPGELVRVKSHEEILATVDANNLNRGLSFDVELAPYCGGVYRVRTRVERFIDEKTGRMKTLKTPAIILEDVWCRSRFSAGRMFCPRAIYSWWREIWLERVPADESGAASRPASLCKADSKN